MPPETKDVRERKDDDVGDDDDNDDDNDDDYDDDEGCDGDGNGLLHGFIS